MKKKKIVIAVSVILVIVAVVGIGFTVRMSLHNDGEEYTFIEPNGKVHKYYIDDNGKAYTYVNGDKLYFLPNIPSDVLGKNMTAPYVYSTTEPTSGELNSDEQS